MNGEGGRGETADATPLFVGAVAALATVAIGIGLVVVASTSGSDSVTAGRAEASVAAPSPTSTTTSTTSTTTTTTTAPPFFGVDPNAPSTAPPVAPVAPAVEPEPWEIPGRATADPSDEPFVGLPNPEGISTTLETCNWSPANGGQLQASGTVTASPETDEVWWVSVYWLQNDRELDDHYVTYELPPGATWPWTLTKPAPLPPADPFRCVVEVE